MFYFQSNVLRLPPSFMELMWLLGSLAGFMGEAIYMGAGVRSLRSSCIHAFVRYGAYISR
jgi:hypothetical protein